MEFLKVQIPFYIRTLVVGNEITWDNFQPRLEKTKKSTLKKILIFFKKISP